jgi:hypothetical protein
MDLSEESDHYKVQLGKIFGRSEKVLAEDLAKTCEIFKDIAPKTLVDCQYYMRKS